jgi:osmotically-inducible protein OsmY
MSLEAGFLTDRTHEPAGKHPTARAAERLFEQCPYAALRELSCEFHEGLLILKGRVDSFYLKSVAQTVARGVAGVREIENHLEVEDVPARRARAGSRGESARAGVA